MKNFYKRKSCRLCDSAEVNTVLPLKRSPLCDAYIKSKKRQKFYDLNLTLCNNCNFAQIDTVVNPKIIYRNYIYVTSSSMGLRKHFKKYTKDVCKFLNFEKSKFVVDIGSNDGILLSFFKDKNHKVLGIDPSLSAATDAKKKNIETLNSFFNLNLAKKIINKYGKADLITVNNLFANVDDLYSFTKSLETLLASDGVLIIESSYLKEMVNKMVFDFIYHEHLSYLSIIPLKLFFKKFGLKLIKIEKVNTKGGSLRYYCARELSKWKDHISVKKFTNTEKKFNISKKTFSFFNKKIEFNKKKITNFLSKCKKLKVIAYGASATSTTLISHYRLNNFIKYIVDDNPGKKNTFSPGYNIPVYGFEKIITDKPDIIIILAWRYKTAILKKLKKINYKNVVIPLPQFKVLQR